MDLVAQTLKDEGGRVLATLIRLTRDIGHAEDALQEASIAALQTWPENGIPDKPGAWLLTTARRKALDRLRRETVRRPKETEAMRLLATDPSDEDQHQDELRLLFTCCHPALSIETQVALALKTIGGLSTTEIARLFLVSDSTMGQRISRAKKKIRVARIPYRVPDDHELPERLRPVLAAIYLIFTTGHHPPEGALNSRLPLVEEALYLGRKVADLMPDEPECAGLLALMLATAGRIPGRVDEHGGQILLPEQNRQLWDLGQIEEASSILNHVLPLGRVGPYQLQAAIAAVHSDASSYATTDWAEIAALYDLLTAFQADAVTLVNRAIAHGQVHGPDHGLQILNAIEGGQGWHLYWSTKAHFYRASGRLPEARGAYEQALVCSPSAADEMFLRQQLSNLA